MFEALHPINAAGLVLNGSMMLCLVIVISVGRRKLKARKSGRALTLLTEPRQCLVFFRRLHSGIPATLPALTKEDHI
jgi:hypothetical protein